MFYSKMPFLRFVLALSLGIVLQNRWDFPWMEIVGCCSILLFVALLADKYLLWRSVSYFEGAFILSSFVWIGVVMECESRQVPFDASHLCGNVLVEIDAPPVEKLKTIRIDVRIVDDMPGSEQRLSFYVAKDTSSRRLTEGDYLLVNSSCLEQSMDTSKEKNLSYYIPSKEWRRCGRNDSFSLKKTAHGVQKYLTNVFRRYGIEKDELSVLSALTVGDKSLLDRDLRKAYSSAGASHILAVSGLHVGVVYFVFTFLLSQILRGGSRSSIRSVVALLALWSYTFVTGLSPSVVRASVMLSMVAVAQLIDRRSQTMNTVFASAFFMLLFHPSYLFDVGFQLSYVAVLSILLFQEPIYQTVVCHHKMVDKAWSLLSVTLAAQLGTMPLVLYYFHQFSNYFWLSGFVVIPLSSIIIYLSMVLWIVQGWTAMGELLATILQWLVSTLNDVVCRIEGFAGAVVDSLRFCGWDVFFVYLLCMSLWLFCRKQTFRSYSSTLLVLFVYVLFQTINKIFFVT